MKKLSTWLLIMFMAMFWIFRIVVTFTSSIGTEMGIEIPNMNIEVAILFITIVLMLLVIKRKTVGGILYLVVHIFYYAEPLFTTITTVINGSLNINQYMSLVVYFVALILPVAVLLDLLLDKNRQNNPRDKKTDWFYDNEEYDREMDDRADRNNYRL